MNKTYRVLIHATTETGSVIQHTIQLSPTDPDQAVPSYIGTKVGELWSYVRSLGHEVCRLDTYIILQCQRHTGADTGKTCQGETG